MVEASQPINSLHRLGESRVVCAGWADAEGRHPCGKVLGAAAGVDSRGLCPQCLARLCPELVDVLLSELEQRGGH